jgi:hypothetical protein
MTIPAWAVKAVTTTVISLSLGGAVAWATRSSSRSHAHETRISVMEEHQKNIDSALQDLKSGQAEQRSDIKEVLKRLPRR